MKLLKEKSNSKRKLRLTNDGEGSKALQKARLLFKLFSIADSVSYCDTLLLFSILFKVNVVIILVLTAS
jgi:hypothetical protein